MSIKPYQRSERVAKQIHQEVAMLMQRRQDIPLWQNATVTGVEVSKDLKYAKVFVGYLKDQDSKKYIKALNETTKLLRQLISRSLNLRVTPELRFVFDKTLTEGVKLSKLIDTAVAEIKDDATTEIIEEKIN